MTTLQIHIFNAIALSLTVITAFLTRATPRRIVGALLGAGAAGVFGLAIVFLGMSAGLWNFYFPHDPFFLALLWLDFTLCAYAFLLTWRIARRFGGRGLFVAAFIAAAIGPFRDSAYMKRFPEWGSYAPGLAPLLAISATYLVLGIVGHGVMRMVAGPAAADRLARTTNS
jgi:hypothetical protein